jgi:hypothetical protein
VALFADTFGRAPGRTVHVDYDADPRGSRFVMVGSQETTAELGVILNWFEEVRRLAPRGR